ncbi:MAG: metallophosphoesterase, partial [Candidatus Omnitrophota bacterium]
HSPDLAQDLEGLNIDLYLAGHTHGGQVNVPFYGALITCSRYGKKYESGKYRVNNMVLYVNRGIGMEGGDAPRVRFLCRPQITIFDIGPAS